MHNQNPLKIQNNTLTQQEGVNCPMKESTHRIAVCSPAASSGSRIKSQLQKIYYGSLKQTNVFVVVVVVVVGAD